jgi:hypothetical protein
MSHFASPQPDIPGAIDQLRFLFLRLGWADGVIDASHNSPICRVAFVTAADACRFACAEA